jgi:hypothetical protein
MTLPPPSRYARAVGMASWGDVFQARKKGASWDELRTSAGLSALGRAVVDKDTIIVRQLLDLGAPVSPVDLINGSRFSPLWASLEREDPEMLGLLLDAGADPNEESPDDPILRPLHRASTMFQADAVLKLLKAGAQPDGWPHSGKPDPDFLTRYPLPLAQWAVRIPHRLDQTAPFLALIEAGANPVLPTPPYKNTWELVQDQWASILAQKSSHPQIGIALAALEKAMLESETPQGGEERGRHRL